MLCPITILYIIPLFEKNKTESFEVIINDKLIHSKLESGIIPNFDEMVQIVMTFKEE